jgi:hypothetical protein
MIRYRKVMFSGNGKDNAGSPDLTELVAQSVFPADGAFGILVG